MSKPLTPVAELTLSETDNEFARKVLANEMNPIVSVYQSLINLGCTDEVESTTHRYIKATNFIAINAFIVSLVFVGYAIFWEKWLWCADTVAGGLVCIATMALNAYGKTIASRVTYIIGGNLVIFFSALMVGPQAQAEYFLIICPLLPFLLIPVNKKFWMTAGVFLPLTLLVVYYALAPHLAYLNFSLQQQSILHYVNLVTEVLLVLGIVLQFVIAYSKAEEELELSRMQMFTQTGELRRSNADLEQFAYIISHDLKAPVRNISSFMNLLLHKHGPGLNDEAREFVSYSHSGAKRLERLIDDVLAYCRIGINLPQSLPVNLNDVVNTIKFEAREKLYAMDAEIVLERELPVVNNVHASLMYHVFQNLINNGLKFNKSEKPEVSINWTNSLNYYTFSVHDNGIGISQEHSNIIFQMFKRLHNEQEYDGTGIGLAICKKIVEYYHGEIWFESEQGRGTTFCFTIRKF